MSAVPAQNLRRPPLRRPFCLRFGTNVAMRYKNCCYANKSIVLASGLLTLPFTRRRSGCPKNAENENAEDHFHRPSPIGFLARTTPSPHRSRLDGERSSCRSQRRPAAFRSLITARGQHLTAPLRVFTFTTASQLNCLGPSGVFLSYRQRVRVPRQVRQIARGIVPISMPCALA